MKLDSLIQRTPGMIEAEIDGDVVALNIDKGNCYGLNNVASHIWKLTTDPIRVSDLCARLVTEYNVDLPTCQRDVLDVLAELEAEGMVTVLESAA